jgi:hypothetical protein
LLLLLLLLLLFLLLLLQAPFEDPVVAADGFTYERADITKWLGSSNISPMTGQTLQHNTLLPNTLIKKLVAEMLG